MRFQKGDILRRNAAYGEAAIKRGGRPELIIQMAELYENVADTDDDPLCLIVSSHRPDRIGKKLFFSTDWVEIVEYS